MVQKYQVFINDHLISVTESIESNQQYDSFFCFKEPSEHEIKIIIEFLFVANQPIHAFLLTENPQNLWESLQNQFKIVKAAGGVVKNLRNQLLLIRRLGKWDLPKGKMEDGESPKETALREVEEECGISGLTLGSQLNSTFHMYKYKEELILKETFWFHMSYEGDDLLVPQKEEDIEEALWVSEVNLNEKIKNTYSSLKPMLLGILSEI